MTAVHAEFTARRGEFRLSIQASFDAGATVAILGPNGAGKSTLLRILAGLATIDRGSISIDATVVDDGGRIFVPARNRSAGMVFQDYALFPHLSVLENIAFGPRARGQGRSAAHRSAMDLLERLGIASLADRRPAHISGGQAQRVALARALATQPSVLLLDEPLAALDAETRDAVRLELQRQLATYPGCAILVTHDPLDAMVLADRVLVLEQGSIVQDGTPVELGRRPQSAYVAALMGVNLLRGRADAGRFAVDEGGELHLADLELAGRALAVIRPEAVTIHLERPQGSARNVWPGTVNSMQTLHDRVRVLVDGTPPIVATVTPAAVADLRLGQGSPVWLSVKAVEIDAYPTPGH